MTDTPTTDALIADEAVQDLVALHGRLLDEVKAARTAPVIRTEAQAMTDAAVIMTAMVEMSRALAQPRAGASGEREAAWRDGWSECKNRLTEDEAFCLTEDVEQDAWLDSDTAVITRSEADEAPGVEIPAGMVLVPIEPTEAMCSAAAFGLRNLINSVPFEERVARWGAPRKKLGYCIPHNEKHRARYKAMVTAYTPIAQPVAPSREAVARAREIAATFWERFDTVPHREYAAAIRCGERDDCEGVQIAILALTPDAAKSDAVEAGEDDPAYALPLPPEWALDQAARNAGFKDWFAVPATFRDAVNRRIIVNARVMTLATPTAPNDQGDALWATPTPFGSPPRTRILKQWKE